MSWTHLVERIRRLVLAEYAKRPIVLMATAGYAVAGLLSLSSANDAASANAWLVFLTGLVLIWYTRETQELRRAAWAQRELDIQPLVIVEKIDPAEFGGKEFRIRNLGRGVALNVSVDDVPLTDDGEDRYLIRFEESIAFLPPNQTALIASASYQGSRRLGSRFHASLDPRYTTFESTIRVRFSNAEMKQYELIATIAPRDFMIRGMEVTPSGE